MRETKHFEMVTVTNPATQQILSVTRKQYESIYIDKGFELVSRENAKPGIPKTRPAADKGPVSELGSAASIAHKLGIDDNAGNEDLPPVTVVNQPAAARVAGEPMTPARATELSEFADDIARGDLEGKAAGNAETVVAAGDNAGKDVIDEGKKGNANNASSVGSIEEGRDSAKRDRGRGNK